MAILVLKPSGATGFWAAKQHLNNSSIFLLDKVLRTLQGFQPIRDDLCPLFLIGAPSDSVGPWVRT